jgi:hypothetical protein
MPIPCFGRFVTVVSFFSVAKFGEMRAFLFLWRKVWLVGLRDGEAVIGLLIYAI